MKPHSVAQQARDNLRKHHFLAAREQLSLALQKEPNHPDLLCEHLFVESYFGNEEAASQRFAETVGAPRHHDLELFLSRYYYCRQMVAHKRGRTGRSSADISANDWLAAHPYSPEPGIGVRISACLIVKDEEAVLEKCLASLQGIVDEIVVVDTGSTDRTMEIARRFGAVEGYFEWIKDFSAARNHALSLATGEWALWIDADEQLDPSCLEEFETAVCRPHIGGFSIEIINYLDESGTITEFVHSPTRLFRRIPGVQFSEPIHEQITPSLIALGLPWTPLPAAKIHHDGYREELVKSKDKVKRTLEMLEKAVGENPNDPFQLFNLANTHFVAKTYQQAAETAEKCVRNLAASGADYGCSAFQIWATALDMDGRSEEAVKVCEFCATTAYSGIVNEYLWSIALYNLGRYVEAHAAVDRCLALSWPENFVGDKAIADFRRYGHKAMIFGAQENWSEALNWYDETLSRQPGYPPALLGRGEALLKMERLDEAELTYRMALSNATTRWAADRGLGMIAAARGDFSTASRHYKAAWDASPSDIGLWESWAFAVIKLGDPVTPFQMLEKYQPLDANLLMKWADALASVGRLDEALGCFRRAMTLAPQDANIQFSCGDLLYKLGYYPQAAEIYHVGLQLRPEFAEGWFVLGNAMAQMNLDQGAEGCYRQALNLDPNHTKAKANLNVVIAA